MTLELRRLATPLTVAGVLVFILASIVSSNFLYGLSLETFAAGAACFLAVPLNPRARSVALAQGGLLLCVASAVIDGALDFANAVGTATSVLTIGIIAGAVLAAFGRTTR